MEKIAAVGMNYMVLMNIYLLKMLIQIFVIG